MEYMLDGSGGGGGNQDEDDDEGAGGLDALPPVAAVRYGVTPEAYVGGGPVVGPLLEDEPLVAFAGAFVGGAEPGWVAEAGCNCGGGGG